MSLKVVVRLALIVMFYFTPAWQQRVVHVVPDGLHRSDFGERGCTVEECYIILAEFGHNLEVRSNLKIVFLPGTHIASRNVSLHGGVYHNTNVTNFVLTAANFSAGATISCKGSVGFAFVNMTNLEISGLTFENCSQNFTNHKGFVDYTFYTLYILDSKNVNVTDVTIRYGRGFGLYVEKPYGRITISRANYIQWS